MCPGTMLDIFTTQDIENARGYKYSGSSDSITYRFIGRPFHEWAINLFPTNLAPNCITLIGFAAELYSFLYSYWDSRQTNDPLYPSSCYLNGICLLIYQFMDAMDGKQARRTGTSSPLGQFFDHGIDALVTVLEMMKISMTFQMMCNETCFFFMLFTCIGFYTTSWEEFNTGTFYLGYISGPDEGLLLLAFAHILTGHFVELMDITEKPIIKYIFLGGFAVTIIGNVTASVKAVIQNKTTFNKFFFSLLPLLVTVLIHMIHFYSFIDNSMYPEYIMSMGFLICFQAQILVCAHLVQWQPIKLYRITVICGWIAASLPMFIRTLELNHRFWLYYLFVLLFGVGIFDFLVIYGFHKGLDATLFVIRGKHNVIRKEQTPPEPEVKLNENLTFEKIQDEN